MTHVESPDGTSLPVRIEGPANAAVTFVLAPGAGTSMSHPSLAGLQHSLAARGLRVVTFDFPYRARGRGAPDRLPVLIAAYRAIIDAVRPPSPARLYIGGRSMGGRVSSHVAAASVRVDGLIFLSFPLHPPGKPGIDRAAHLSSIKAPMRFIQGTRDTFARWDLFEKVLASLPTATLLKLDEADHSLHVPKRTGRTNAQIQQAVVDDITAWTSDDH